MGRLDDAADAAPRMSDAAARGRETRWFLLAVLLHGLVYFLAVAPWMGEDEPWHFEYASQVADGHGPWGGGKVEYYDAKLATGADAPYDERWDHAASQLQTRRRFAGLDDAAIAARQTQILESMERHDFYARVDWTGGVGARADFDEVQPLFTATTHSPGYYLVLGAWLALWPGEGVDGQLYWARVLSLLLYVLTCWAGLEFARAAFTDRSLVWATAIVVAWLPMHARQAALVNNDVLARTLSALVWMVCARRLAGVAGRREFALAVVAALLALFVKTTAVAGLGVLLLTLVLDARRVRDARRVLMFAAGAVLALVGVVAYWHFQHSPVLPRNIEAFLLRVGRGASASAMRELATTWIGAFNWYSRPMSDATYGVVGGALVAACAGGLLVLARGASGVARTTLLLCVLGVLVQCALPVLRGVGHGRYLMPALLPIAAWLASGVCSWGAERTRARLSVALVAALVLYDAWFLWGGLVPNEYGVWGA